MDRAFAPNVESMVCISDDKIIRVEDLLPWNWSRHAA